MRREFDTIVEERGVVGRLNELDGLVGEARRRREIEGQEGNGGAGGRERRAMHTLPAKELCSAHLLPSLTSHSAELSTRQETLQNENVDILSRVMEQRKQIEAMVRGLENVIADLDASVETLQEAGIDGLREEVRGVDEDVRTTG